MKVEFKPEIFNSTLLVLRAKLLNWMALKALALVQIEDLT